MHGWAIEPLKPRQGPRTSGLNACVSRAIEHMPEQMGSVGGRVTSYDTEREGQTRVRDRQS